MLFQRLFWACVIACPTARPPLRRRNNFRCHWYCPLPIWGSVLSEAFSNYSNGPPFQWAPALRLLWEKPREIDVSSPPRCHLCAWRATAPDGSPETRGSLAKVLAETGSRKYEAGLGGRDALREEGGKGAAAALTVSGPRAACTRGGVGRGSCAGPDPPREQAAGVRARQRLRRTGSCGLPVSAPRGGPAPARTGASGVVSGWSW